MINKTQSEDQYNLIKKLKGKYGSLDLDTRSNKEYNVKALYKVYSKQKVKTVTV